MAEIRVTAKMSANRHLDLAWIAIGRAEIGELGFDTSRQVPLWMARTAPMRELSTLERLAWEGYKKEYGRG